MDGGSVSDNTVRATAASTGYSAYSYGGGIYAKDSLSLSGGSISGNAAASSSVYSPTYGYGSGGGVHASIFTMNGGSIKFNRALTWGGGVGGKQLTMNNGIISENYAGRAGGGVSSSTITMYGGTISENCAGSSSSYEYGDGGGGAYVIGTSGTFTMNDGTISGNEDSGVSIRDGGNAILNGGIISNNNGDGVVVITIEHVQLTNADTTFTIRCGIISDNAGYGVHLINGSFDMEGGVISGNIKSSVYDDGLFTMNAGTISDHEDCGVYVTYSNDSTFTMNDGTIADNNTGVYISIVTSYATIAPVSYEGAFKMLGGTISGNSVGVYYYSGNMRVSGSPNISGNLAGNVYLKSNQEFYVYEPLTAEAKIGVTMEERTGWFAFGPNETYIADALFTSDSRAYTVKKVVVI